MNERQYLLQHILHLAAELKRPDIGNSERTNVQGALQFYAAALQKLDRQKPPEIQ